MNFKNNNEKEVFLDNLEKMELIPLEVSRGDVERKRIESYIQFFETLLERPKAFKKKVLMTVSGFEHTNDEVYQIQPIRDFYRKLFDVYPVFLYFLSSIDDLDKIIVTCFSDFEVALPIDRKPLSEMSFMDYVQRDKYVCSYTFSRKDEMNLSRGLVKLIMDGKIGDKEAEETMNRFKTN